MNCLECHTETENVKFCTRNCAASYNNRGVTRRARNPDNWCVCGNRKVRHVPLCRSCSPKVTSKQKKLRKAEYQRIRYRARSDYLKDLLGNACVECGTIENLEFDHINPEDKSFTLSGKFKEISLEVLEKELEKCQLLCKDCHIEKTKVEAKGREQVNKFSDDKAHGTSAGYNRLKCRCDVCKEWKRFSRL